MNAKIVSNLQKMIDVNTPIIYINDYDFVRIDELIEQAIDKKKVYEWNPATGGTHFVSKEKQGEDSLEKFLYQQYNVDADHSPECFLLLKEIEDFIEDPKVKSLLMHIAQRKLYDYTFNTTIIIVSTIVKVPQAIEKYVSFLDIDLPNEEEIEALIRKHVEVNHDEEGFNEKDIIPKLMPSLKGLTAFEIDRTLDMAMSSNGTLRADDKTMIDQQKKQMVRQSGILELIDANEQLEDIGGMDVLKRYLEAKAKVMEQADIQKYGVQMPKGVFIVGMPGCGKSLCAKASAAAFKANLLKLDMGSMMGKYVGESEGNLRKAIKVAEAAATCILWIDEIEKAFSGVGGQNNDIVTRMFGYLLGWLQDKKSRVYVIATANNADNLPPELKRKGRFDEIFCVNLPTDKERKAIFEVHLNKKAKAENVSLDDVDYDKLAEATKGFNGADIEAVVNETTEHEFLRLLQTKKDEKEKLTEKLIITTEKLIQEANKTVSISKSCKEQIENMRKIFKESNFKNASE